MLLTGFEQGAVESDLTWLSSVDTPAFVIDQRRILAALEPIVHAREASGFLLLFATNASTNLDFLQLLSGHVDGFSASSPFDSRLARELLAPGGVICNTGAAHSERDIQQIRQTCDYVVLNSIGQWTRYKGLLAGHASAGLRINPFISFKSDPRYDPARPDSKLGVSISTLAELVERDPAVLAGLEGVHFHTNCESTDFSELLTTVEHVAHNLGPLLKALKWINIGGGYIFAEGADVTPFHKAVRLLKNEFGLTVMIEPGFSLASTSASLVATILDILPSRGHPIAVMDTTVNHAPEVFEYQCPPDVVGHDAANPHRYVLAGRSCLAGDIFGTYAFAEPLEIGGRIVLANLGAYAMVKAHTFNGINLPSLYTITTGGELKRRKTFEYQDYRSRLALGGN